MRACQIWNRTLLFGCRDPLVFVMVSFFSFVAVPGTSLAHTCLPASFHPMLVQPFKIAKCHIEQCILLSHMWLYLGCESKQVIL